MRQTASDTVVKSGILNKHTIKQVLLGSFCVVILGLSVKEQREIDDNLVPKSKLSEFQIHKTRIHKIKTETPKTGTSWVNLSQVYEEQQNSIRKLQRKIHLLENELLETNTVLTTTESTTTSSAIVFQPTTASTTTFSTTGASTTSVLATAVSTTNFPTKYKLPSNQTHWTCPFDFPTILESNPTPASNLRKTHFLVNLSPFGPNNQFRGFRDTILLAYLLNRTIVLPLFFKHNSDPSQNSQKSNYQTAAQ